MEESTTSLDDLLDDTVQEAPAEPVAPEQTETGPARDESGRFAAKETGVEDTGPPPDKLPQEEYKALREEREKRQQAEALIESLKAQIQTQPKEPPAPPPSVWEDEQAFGGHLVNQAVGAASVNARLDMSEMLASQSHDDFDEMKAEFLKMAESNPTIAQQALEAKHPWEKAYQIAKNARTMTELGATDLDGLKAKLREELKAEMQATPPVSPTLPPTLSTARNAGARTGPAWSGPSTLDDLLA